MLVLARKVNQTIEIGADVVVTVTAIRGNAVRLGITAPPAVPIHRGEVAAAIHEEGRKHTRSQAARIAAS